MYIGSKKTNKQKTHKHFSYGPCGTIVPRTNPHPSQGQTGQNGDFTVEFNRERPVCPRDGSHFVPGRGPVCPRDGACLSRTPSRRKCLCLLVFFLPEDWVELFKNFGVFFFRMGCTDDFTPTTYMNNHNTKHNNQTQKEKTRKISTHKNNNCEALPDKIMTCYI